MKRKSLIDTNPHLKDPVKRRKLIERSVRTSCGVEGIRVNFSDKHFSIPGTPEEKE